MGKKVNLGWTTIRLLTLSAILSSSVERHGVLSFTFPNNPQRFSSSSPPSRCHLPVSLLLSHPRSSSCTSSWLRMSSTDEQTHSKTNIWSDNDKSTSQENTAKKKSTKVPIVLLCGFLGSGKTTALQHLLENRHGFKVGVIVNDVASVNIDSKQLISSTTTSSSSSASAAPDGIMELQNGCVCCSLASELISTIDKLIDFGQQKYHNIPKNAKEEEKLNKEVVHPEDLQGGEGVEAIFQQRQQQRRQQRNEDGFDAIVVELSGVANPTAIVSNWEALKTSPSSTSTGNNNVQSVTEKAEMSNIITLVDTSTFGTDFLSWDTAGQRTDWVHPTDECGSEQRKVPELLAEQVEAADIVLLNKADLASQDQIQMASAMVRNLNDHATIEVVEYGKVSPSMILPMLGLDVDEVVDEPGEVSESTSSTEAKDNNVSHCCESKSNANSVDHDHHHDSDHDHHHHHNHDHEHEHEHEHDHSLTDVDNLGITSFVYRANRPFDTGKLLKVIQTWPVPIKDELDLDPYNLEVDDSDENKIHFQEDAYLGVLRSKGFCWLAPTKWDGPQNDAWRHDATMYWSHAGRHFGIQVAGQWWATLPRDELKEYFVSDPERYKHIIENDFVSEKYGDRRQELVFIGINIDEDKITCALNACLLSDKGMERYQQQLDRLVQTA